MSRFDQSWVDALVGATEGAERDAGPCRVLYVVTDTEDGKAAFHLDLDEGHIVAGVAGRLPRGEAADVTITAKESVLLQLWAGDRSRDAAFMAGDLKIEGDYQRWLDELVPLFEADEWSAAWSTAGGSSG